MKRFGLALFISLLPFLSMAQWSDDPMVNTQITNLTGEQVLPKIAVCPNGDYFIGFSHWLEELQRSPAKTDSLAIPCGMTTAF